MAVPRYPKRKSESKAAPKRVPVSVAAEVKAEALGHAPAPKPLTFEERVAKAAPGDPIEAQATKEVEGGTRYRCSTQSGRRFTLEADGTFREGNLR